MVFLYLRKGMLPSAPRVAQLYHSRQRVASRWRWAGLVQAPPAMQEAIIKWVTAVVAANTSVAIDAEIERNQESIQFWKNGYAEAREAIANMRAAPTSWSVYKEFAESMSQWGGQPYSRRKIRDFQKLTPERREELLTTMAAETDRAARNIDSRESHVSGGSDELLGEQKRLRKYRMPGVSAMEGDEVTRKFRIDTDGWRYGTQDYKDRLLETMRAAMSGDVRDYLQMLEGAGTDPKSKPMRDFLEKKISEAERMIESGDFPGWKEITVTLARKPVQGEAASWNSVQKTIRIVVPTRAQPYQLKGLAGVLEHELVHFAQAWLSAIQGHTIGDLMNGIRAPAGLPSLDIQTPEFRQHMSPKSPKPEIAQEAKRVLQKLRQLGVNTRTVNWHDLDDVEFYSELGDAVREFKQSWDRANLEGGLLRPAIRHFTFTASRDDHQKYVEYDGERYGPLYNFPRSKFFKALKAIPGARGKTRKALSEFVKAVT